LNPDNDLSDLVINSTLKALPFFTAPTVTKAGQRKIFTMSRSGTKFTYHDVKGMCFFGK
jgi:hypothetical protein